MGGMNSGRKPYSSRRARAKRLRARGHSLSAIAAALGCTRQAVQQLLGPRPSRRRPVPCAGCGGPLNPAAGPHDRALGLCLRCLELRPDAPFGQRLQAHRLAAGLTVTGLARKAGLARATIERLERAENQPRSITLARLAKALDRRMKDLQPRTTGRAQPGARVTGAVRLLGPFFLTSFCTAAI
jgi:transcriptional regulator with XRE-family HTH domain